MKMYLTKCSSQVSKTMNIYMNICRISKKVVHAFSRIIFVVTTTIDSVHVTTNFVHTKKKKNKKMALC